MPARVFSVDTYDLNEFVDEEKKRVLAAVEEKTAGKQIVAPEHVEPSSSAQVLDMVAALRASLQQKASSAAPTEPAKSVKQSPGERKPVKRAPATVIGEAAPPKGRAGKK